MSEELKVRYRGGFSDRRKISPLSTEMQLNDFDEGTRNNIANLLKRWVDEMYVHHYETGFYTALLDHVYREFVDDQKIACFKYDPSKSFSKYIYEPIRDKAYSEVLDIVEFVTFCASEIFQAVDKDRRYSGDHLHENCSDSLNGLFESEFVGYRMINGEIAPITDEIEMKAIEDSLDIKFEGCRSHIKKSLGFLSDRENPDYKNSIKESISAVEATCRVITRKDKAMLKEALSSLERKGLNLHPALKKAFEQLYGYASDEGGIRHAEHLFENDVTFNEAKFFLVSCCAFVNYLVSTYGDLKNGGAENV